MTESAVRVENISKAFGAYQAVKDLSFDVPKASCFGLLGPNGAGKTTMMNILVGRVKREPLASSRVNVLGYDPETNELEIKFLTGIVPQENNLDIELSVIQNLIIYSKFYGIPRQEALSRIDELLSFMELHEKKDARIRELSGGMQRRLIIARALINTPHLLILDEPTTGLDPQVRQVIWDKMRMLKQTGVTILLTTHYMDEAQQLCDDLIIMHGGRELLRGKPANLIQKEMEAYVLEISNASSFHRINTGDLRYEVTSARMMIFANDIDRLKSFTQSMAPGDYFLRPANLEDLFLKVTGRRLND